MNRRIGCLCFAVSVLLASAQAPAHDRSSLCRETPKIIPVKWGYRMPFPSGGYMHMMMDPVLDRCRLDKKKETVSLAQLKCASERDAESLEPTIQGARRIVRKVLSGGLREFAGIDLESVLRKMDALKFRIFKGGFLLGSGGKRFSAVNLLSENTVILNDLPASLMAYNFWEPGLENYTPLLILHETLGVLGYEDENYEASLALWWISRSNRGDQKEFAAAFVRRFGNVETFRCDKTWDHGSIRNLFLRWAIPEAHAGGVSIVGGGGGRKPEREGGAGDGRIQLAANGGASVVGGGGDLHEMMFKAKLMEEGLKRFGSHPDFRGELKILSLSVQASQKGPYGYNAAEGRLTIPSRWKLEVLEGNEVLNLQNFDTRTWINRYVVLIR